MITAGVTETVLPDNEVVGEVEPAVLDLDCLDRPIQDRARADLVLLPIPGSQQAECMVAQTRLVALPVVGQAFVEALERMPELGLNQRTATFEGTVKGNIVDACGIYLVIPLPDRRFTAVQPRIRVRLAGRPPFRPLERAAAAFAGLVALPPSEPRMDAIHDRVPNMRSNSAGT